MKGKLIKHILNILCYTMMIISCSLTFAQNISGITASSQSEQKRQDVKATNNNPFAIAFYKQNYFLPYYHTGTPFRSSIMRAPDNQVIKHHETKGQISFQLPLADDMFGKKLDLYAGYTQLFYWQVYQDSAFFRETNYEPELFIEYTVNPNVFINLGVVHQSNGAGGDKERSWNRLYTDLEFSGQAWYLSVKPWISVAKHATKKYNKDIMHYMGYGRLLFSYKIHDFVLSAKLRNAFESGFKRSAQEVSLTIPFGSKIKGMLQFFHGYGQSLVEYNHKTTSFGLGIALNDWI